MNRLFTTVIQDPCLSIWCLINQCSVHHSPLVLLSLDARWGEWKRGELPRRPERGTCHLCTQAIGWSTFYLSCLTTKEARWFCLSLNLVMNLFSQADFFFFCFVSTPGDFLESSQKRMFWDTWPRWQTKTLNLSCLISNKAANVLRRPITI